MVNKHRFLVVDDEPRYIDYLRRILGIYDTVEIDGVEHPEDALMLLGGGEKFDMIFLDLHFPRIRGMAVFDLFRNIVKQTPVVVLTEAFDEGLIVKLLEAGATGFALKSAVTSYETFMATYYSNFSRFYTHRRVKEEIRKDVDRRLSEIRDDMMRLRDLGSELNVLLGEY